MKAMQWLLIGSMLTAGSGVAFAQGLAGRSPASSGVFHSSPERPDKPIVDPVTGLVWSTNPSTVDLPNQPQRWRSRPLGRRPH